MDKRHNYRQKPKREEVVDNYTPSGKETDLIRPIEELGLPEPIFAALKAGKFETISDLAKRRVTQMYKVQNIGKKQCWEITKKLSKFAIAFRPEDVVVAEASTNMQAGDKTVGVAINLSNADSRASGSQQGKQVPVGSGDNANSVAPTRQTRQSRFEERNKNREERNRNQNPSVRVAPYVNVQNTSGQNANTQNGSNAVAGQNGYQAGRFAPSGNNQNANNQNSNNQNGSYPNGNQGGRFQQNANNRNGNLGNRNFPSGNNQGGNQGARFGQNNGQNNFNKNNQNNQNNNNQRNAQPQCKIPFKNPEQRNSFFNTNKGLNDSLTRQYQGYTISQIIMGKRQRPLPSAPMREVLTPQSVVKFCRKGKWGYKDWKGNVLIQPIFDEAFSFNEGLACVEKNSKLGFIDLKGDTIVDFVYDSATSFSDGIASVTKDEKSGYIDKEGKVVIPFIYEIATQFVENRAIVFNEGRWGVLAKNGEVMWR